MHTITTGMRASTGRSDHLKDVCIVKIHEMRSGDRTKGKEGERQYRRGEDFTKIYRCRCSEIPVPKPSKNAQDPNKDTDGDYQRPERYRAVNAKERIGHVHEKAGEHQRGERESDSVDGCLDSTKMVGPKNSQDENTGHEGEEEKASKLSEKGDWEAKRIKKY